MMRMGVGIRSPNSMVIRSITLVLILLVLQFDLINSSKPTTYMVGDDEGWDVVIDMESWTQDKNFHAGDILVFKYDYQSFDVAVVNQTGHDSCSVNEGAKVYESGDDTIQLLFGPNYFIDTNPEICAAGLKMAINATAPPPTI